jgi:RNA polymerase sigma factor (sigma-70 family)
MSLQRSELELFRAVGSEENPRDLAELTDRLRRCVQWVLRRMGGGRMIGGETEDIVSDALLRLERLRERGFSGSDREFRSYLYKVVVSACLDARNQQRWVTSLDASVTLPDGEEKPLAEVVKGMVDPLLSSEETLASQQEGDHLRRALEQLDIRCRDLLRRFHLEGVSIRDLAAGTRLNTVEVMLNRCRQRLYTKFLALYVDAGDARWRERVTETAAKLSGDLGKIFVAWWRENQSVLAISKQVGLTAAETKQRLGQAKHEVWRLLAEGGT